MTLFYEREHMKGNIYVETGFHYSLGEPEFEGTYTLAHRTTTIVRIEKQFINLWYLTFLKLRIEGEENVPKSNY